MRVSLKRTAVAIGVLALSLSISGCEDKETDNIAKAQDCLDKIDSSNYQSADSCLSYVSNYDSQQANIIKCSGKLLAAGLTTQRIAKAYTILSDDATYGTHKDAAMIAAFALDPTKASQAQPYCIATQLKGFIYVANIVMIGSSMAAATAGLGFDPTNPSSFPSAPDVNAIMTNCTDFSGGTCNHSAMGTAAASVAESYCVGSNADSDTCVKINAAVAAAGGDPVLVSKQLFCLFDGKTYSTVPSEGCY